MAITATHENGYTGEVRSDGALFIDDENGKEIFTAKSCSIDSEEALLSILSDLPSFLEKIDEHKRKEAKKSANIP